MELVVRATVVYWFLWLVVRGTGKRSLAEITPLEMIMIVVLGVVVGGMIVAMYLPIFDMINAVQ